MSVTNKLVMLKATHVSGDVVRINVPVDRISLSIHDVRLFLSGKLKLEKVGVVWPPTDLHRHKITSEYKLAFKLSRSEREEILKNQYDRLIDGYTASIKNLREAVRSEKKNRSKLKLEREATMKLLRRGSK